MSKISKIVYLSVSTVFFIIFNMFLSNLIINNGYKLPANPILDVLLIKNQGAAFNIFDGYKVFLVTFAIFAIIGIFIYTIKHIQKISTIGLFFVALLVAGIYTNMYERIVYGYVKDFLKLNFIDFPVFNISDILINIGVIGIVVIILKNNYCKNK